MDLQTIINFLPQLPQKEVPNISESPFFKRDGETPVLTPEEFKAKMSLNPMPPQQESIPINWDLINRLNQPEILPVSQYETPQESIPVDWEGILRSLQPEIFPISPSNTEPEIFPIDWESLIPKPITMGEPSPKPPIGAPTAKGGEIVRLTNQETIPNTSIFHETGNLRDFLGSGDASGLNVSTDKNLALGQGGKGIVIEWDASKMLGDRGYLRPIKKPGTDIVGQKEYSLLGGDYSRGLKSITIKPETKLGKVEKVILGRDFNKVANEDGSITYTPKLSPKEGI